MRETDRIETALRALLDSPDAVDLAELIEAHAAAQHTTSHGSDDAPAVHERDALLAAVADALTERLPARTTTLPNQHPRRAA